MTEKEVLQTTLEALQIELNWLDTDDEAYSQLIDERMDLLQRLEEIKKKEPAII